jgi:hypothetical protein
VSRLTDLLRQARQVDPQLGADLESEITALTKRRTFGLVFERQRAWPGYGAIPSTVRAVTRRTPGAAGQRRPDRG